MNAARPVHTDFHGPRHARTGIPNRLYGGENRSLCAPGPEAEAGLEAGDIEVLRTIAESAQTAKRSGPAKEDGYER